MDQLYLTAARVRAVALPGCGGMVGIVIGTVPIASVTTDLRLREAGTTSRLPPDGSSAEVELFEASADVDLERFLRGGHWVVARGNISARLVFDDNGKDIGGGYARRRRLPDHLSHAGGRRPHRTGLGVRAAPHCPGVHIALRGGPAPRPRPLAQSSELKKLILLHSFVRYCIYSFINKLIQFFLQIKTQEIYTFANPF